MISCKYGIEGLVWWFGETPSLYGLSFWKDILKARSWVQENIKFSIGDGSKVKF